MFLLTVRIVALTGRPGIGKTTVAVKAAGMLVANGISVDGFYSREARKGGEREGFEIIDFLTGERAVLASIKGDGIRFGKYRVNVSAVDSMVPRIIERALESSSTVVLIDEVGPMELLSPAFARAVERVIRSSNRAIITIHRSLAHPLMKAIINSGDTLLLEVNEENRDGLPVHIVESIM